MAGTEPRSEGARAWARRLALLAFSSGLSLAAAEGAYRGYVALHHRATRDDAAWYENRRRMNTTLYRRSSDPRLVYEPAPGARVEMPYGPAAFNGAGMRDDREHDVVPDPARLRVVMLGDSLVWGEDVARADSLPARVELALGGAARAEVLNFGVTGYDTAQEAVWFERAARAYAPAVVVVVYCLNDVMIASGPYGAFATPDERRARDAQDARLDRLAPVREETLEGLLADEESRATLRLLAHARGIVRQRRYERGPEYRDDYTVLYAQDDARARVARALAQLGASIRAAGARPLLVLSPMLVAWDRYHWTAAHAFVRDAASRAGFTVADPLPVWQHATRPDALRLPGDSMHYGREGNRRFGTFIADAIAHLPR